MRMLYRHFIKHYLENVLLNRITIQKDYKMMAFIELANLVFALLIEAFFMKSFIISQIDQSEKILKTEGNYKEEKDSIQYIRTRINNLQAFINVSGIVLSIGLFCLFQISQATLPMHNMIDLLISVC